MPAPSYANFVLLITQSPQGYQARVIDSPCEDDAVADFTLPPEWADLGDALWHTPRASHHLGQGEGETLDAVELGHRLYDAVFAGEVGTSLVRNLERADNRLRIVLRLDKGLAGLAVLPWEFLYSSHLKRYLSPSAETPFVRYLEVATGGHMQPAPPPLVVLGVLSNPAGIESLDVEGEWVRVQEAISGLGKDRIRLGQIPATVSALQDRLRAGPVHVLHFIGHGAFDEAAKQGALLFEDDEGQPALISADRFKMLLHDQADLRLVFLNACEGAKGGRSDSFAGVAQQLVQQGVPAVVAMQFPVTDTASLTLSREFYKALADGYPVDAAVGEARKAIFGLGDSLEWGTPVLFSRSEDNRLIAVVEPVPACPYPGMVPFQAEDARFFYGREDEIEQMLRHLRHHRLLFVIGPSGSGKSSLIAAGVLPRLTSGSHFPPGHWLVCTFRPGNHPTEALARAIGEDITRPTETIIGQILADHVPARQVLLVIDQFEELFSLTDNEERNRFIDQIQALRKIEQCTLLIAMRADFYPDLMNSNLWPIDVSQRLDIAALRGDPLRRAIRQPAKQAEVEIEEALVERLMADAAGEPGVLPMLQETLQLLWAQVSWRHIALEDYERLGDSQRSGLSVAVATKADATFAEFTPNEQRLVRRIFIRLIQFGQGRDNIRRQLLESELRSDSDDLVTFDRVLKQLAGNRLLTLGGGEGGTERVVDISHERLISDWPQLNKWVKQYQDDEQMRRRLEDKAQEWIRLGRDEGGLLDKTELLEVKRWLSSSGASDLGASSDLLALLSMSRKTINPGWHVLGTTELLVAVLSAAALLSWLYAYLRSNRALGSVQMVTFLFIVSLGIAATVAILSTMRSGPSAIQRLSHNLASRRLVPVGIVVACLISLGAWSQWGIQHFQIERDCRALVFNTDVRAQNIAVITQGINARDAAFFALRLSNTAVQRMIVKVVTTEQASQCHNYLRYIVRVRRDDSAADVEVAYIATIQDAETNSELVEERDVGSDNCRRLDFLALKVLKSTNLLPSGSQIYDSVDLPAPDDCETYFANEDGFRLFQQQDYADAEASLRLAIARYPQFAWAHNNLGMVLSEQGQIDEAIAEFRIAVSLSPSVFEPFETNLENACFIAGQYDCAEQVTLRLIDLYPNDIRWYHQLSVIYREWGQQDVQKYQLAEDTFDYIEKVITGFQDEKLQTENELWLQKNRGILALYRGKLDEAQDLLQSANRPGFSMFHEEIVYYLAWIAQEKGQNDEACGLWKEHARSTPSGLAKDSERRMQYGQEQIITLACR